MRLVLGPASLDLNGGLGEADSRIQDDERPGVEIGGGVQRRLNVG